MLSIHFALFADMQEDVIKCFWCFVNSPTSSSLCTHESRSMFMLCGDAIANVYAVVCRTENGNYKMSIRMDRLVYACWSFEAVAAAGAASKLNVHNENSPEDFRCCHWREGKRLWLGCDGKMHVNGAPPAPRSQINLDLMISFDNVPEKYFPNDFPLTFHPVSFIFISLCAASRVWTDTECTEAPFSSLSSLANVESEMDKFAISHCI